MLLGGRTLILYNIEYEMLGIDGKMASWKANIVSYKNHENAIDLLRRLLNKPLF